MEFIKEGVFYEPLMDRIPFESISGIQIDKIVYQGASQFQEILVFDSSRCGRVLVLDGGLQLCTHDEFAYHETLAFTALSCHENPKKVLIIGGGDGGMAREVLKFPSVESITVCEIDKEVVQICQELLPELGNSFNNPKVDLKIQDAFEYLKEKKNEFDVIICDSTDPEWTAGKSSCLFGEDFYGMVEGALRANGVFLSQSGNNIWQPMLKNVKDFCTSHFPVVKFGFVSVAIFNLSQNGFHLCSLNKDLDVRNPYWKFSDKELDRMNLRFYNHEVHSGSFALPNFLKKYLNDNCGEQYDIVKWMKQKYFNNCKIKL